MFRAYCKMPGDACEAPDLANIAIPERSRTTITISANVVGEDSAEVVCIGTTGAVLQRERQIVSREDLHTVCATKGHLLYLEFTAILEWVTGRNRL